MKLSVNPNRMELLKLKKRLALAKRGHKLLRDKQEELMRRFLEQASGLRALRGELDEKLTQAFGLAVKVRMERTPQAVSVIGKAQHQRLTFTPRRVRVMNLLMPAFEAGIIPDPFVYDIVSAPFETDDFAALMKEAMPKILRLARMESAVLLLSEELEKTRRRVNILEYVLIPNLVETVKAITMKLSELERSTLVRLMRVKEIVRNR